MSKLLFHFLFIRLNNVRCFLLLRKAVFFFCFLVLSTMVNVGAAQNDEIRLVSPMGASVRSAFLPGWGQIYTENTIRGGILFVSFGALLTSSFEARRSYQDIYREYKGVAWQALDAPQNKELQERKELLFERSNQRFKLSQFLFFSSLGIWAYGIIDSYVNGNFYNARVKSEKLLYDTKKIENMEFQLDVRSEQINLTLTANF